MLPTFQSFDDKKPAPKSYLKMRTIKPPSSDKKRQINNKVPCASNSNLPKVTTSRAPLVNQNASF